MTALIITVCISALLVTIPLLLLDFPITLGAIWSSGSLERWSVKLLLPIIFIGSLVISILIADPVRSSLAGLFPSDDPEALVAVALSALLAVMVSGVISRYTSIAYAVVGAIFGCRLMICGYFEWGLAAGIIASWIVAPVLCFLLSLALAAFSSRIFKGRNLVVADSIMLRLSIMASVVFAAAFAWNNGSLVSFFPSFAPEAGFLQLILTLAAVIVLFPLLAGHINSEAWRISDNELDIPVASVFAIMASAGLTMALFSTPWISAAFLTPTPLSVSSLFVASLLGVSLSVGRPAMEGERIVKSCVATASAPILGLLISYCICVILNVSASGVSSARWQGSLTPILILLAIIVAAAAFVLYIRTQRENALRKQIIDSREQQIYAARKSLAAVETRAEMNEKDLLNKLEIKRKELVDFAMGISGQKAYMEEVYGDLKRVRQMPDVQAKDRAVDELLKSLRERMYFSSEMNDFYAQTEILHKDFNMRLSEAYPNLTESERKLANLLRQGFSSKHIASLMNITPKSVEISRYRLRSKLGLQRSDNLIKFIKSI